VLDRKLDAIVVGGGDGSIWTVASVFSGSDVPLGVIPAPEQAVAVIAAGEARSVDVGEVNGEFFVNNSSIGIYPYLVLERERRRRRQGLSKWTAMILAALRVARHLPVRRLVIRIEGWVEPCRARAYSLGTTSIALQCPPSAGVTDWIEANWPSTWPKRKVDCHFFGLPAGAFLVFLSRNATLESSRAERPKLGHARAGCSLRSTAKSKPGSGHLFTGHVREHCACLLRRL
jgi:hypothetical protein